MDRAKVSLPNLPRSGWWSEAQAMPAALARQERAQRKLLL
jgi:hypothetical protein